MKYLRLYEFNDEFKKDYWGENYLEHWVSLTKKDEHTSQEPDGFVIEDGNYFLLKEDTETGDNTIISSGTTSEYNGIYVFDHYDEEMSSDVYTNGTKFLYCQNFDMLKPSESVDPNSSNFYNSIVDITPFNTETGEITVIKISSMYYETKIDTIKRVDYDKSDIQKALEKPLTITALGNGTIRFDLRLFSMGG